MAYTKEDLEEVKRAIIALAKGERVVTVSTAGRTVQYASAEVDKLVELETRIRAELRSSRAPRKFYPITRSGF